jgi:hypothetical protein
MTAASLALVVLIGWLSVLQVVRVGRDRNAPASRAAVVTTAVLGGAAALLLVPPILAGGDRPGRGPDVTAVVLIALLGWLVVQQVLRVGRDDPAARAPRAVRVTTAVLSGAAVLFAVPQFYLMLT